MKKALCVCACVLAVCAVIAVDRVVSQEGGVYLLDGLVSYWKMDETGGVRYDAHSGNNLTDNNTVGYAQGIIINSAESVYPNNEYLSVSDIISSPEISLSAWFSTTGDHSATVFLLSYNSGGDEGEVNLYYVSAYNSYYVSIYEYDDATELECEDFSLIPSVDETEFNHFVLMDDRESMQLSVYVNGEFGASVPYSACSAVFSKTHSYDMRMLNNSDSRIDEVALYDRTLNESEIDVLYNSGAGFSYDLFGLYHDYGVSENGVVSYWALEESTGIRYDSQGSNDLTPYGAPSNAAGRVGSAVELSGSEYLSLDSGDIMTAGESLSVLGWFAVDESLCGSAGDCTAFSVWGGDSEAREWRVSYYANSVYLNVQTISGIMPLYIQAVKGAWHAVGFIYDADAQTCALRVDNQLKITSCVSASFGTESPFYIGYDGVDKLEGLVDEVVYLNTAITETAWLEFFNGGVGMDYYSFVVQSQYSVYLPLVAKDSALVSVESCEYVTCGDGEHCIDGECVPDTDIEGIIEIDYESASWREWAQIFDDLFSPVLKRMEEILVSIASLYGDVCGDITQGDYFVPSGDGLDFQEDQTTLEMVYNFGLALGKPVAYIRVLRSYDVLGLNYMTITVSYIIVVFLFFGFVLAYVIGMRVIRGALDLLKWLYEWIPAKST